MAFPGPHDTVYYNEAGEPIGWSNETLYEPEPDEYELERANDQYEYMGELVQEADQIPEHLREEFLVWWWDRQSRFTTMEAAYETWREIHEN